MSFEYLTILLAILFITLIIEKKNRIRLYNSKRERLEITLFFFCFGVIWDTFAIYRGDWSFPVGKNIGITIGLMPLEEYLFVLIIPYFIITVYKLFDFRSSKRQ
jgi:lycopene cyclase domain-containing protein